MNKNHMAAQEDMATSKISLAFALTHTPGLSDRLQDAPAPQVSKIMDAVGIVRDQLEKSRPDVMIALINDHFDMFSLRNLPTFAIGVSGRHFGPPEHSQEWIQLKRAAHPGAEAYAKTILSDAIDHDFDMTRVASCEFNHNVLLPKKYIWPAMDIPIVPVFINCFCRPLPSWRRCYELGQLIRKSIASRPEKVAIMASGGISHWPPFVDEEEAISGSSELSKRILRWQAMGPEALLGDPQVSKDLLIREKELAASNRELINIEWDKWFLSVMNGGDHESLLSLDKESIYKDGGNGGYEMAMWVCLMGIMNSAPCQTLVYEPVKEWMGGVGIITYS
ncbi:MAG: hypothetical protein H3C28_11865 [Sphingomonadales bacterium]|nr:hypothetical protein [Sphingomonadales bacterium]